MFFIDHKIARAAVKQTGYDDVRPEMTSQRKSRVIVLRSVDVSRFRDSNYCENKKRGSCWNNISDNPAVALAETVSIRGERKEGLVALKI